MFPLILLCSLNAAAELDERKYGDYLYRTGRSRYRVGMTLQGLGLSVASGVLGYTVVAAPTVAEAGDQMLTGTVMFLATISYYAGGGFNAGGITRAQKGLGFMGAEVTPGGPACTISTMALTFAVIAPPLMPIGLVGNPTCTIIYAKHYRRVYEGVIAAEALEKTQAELPPPRSSPRISFSINPILHRDAGGLVVSGRF